MQQSGSLFVFQLPSRVWLFVTPWTAAGQASLCLNISRSLPKFMSIALVMSSNHLILWCPLLLLPSISEEGSIFPAHLFFFFPSIRDFSNESVVCIRQPTGSLQFFYFFPTSPLERYPSNSKNVGKKINYYFVLCQELKNILNLILTSTLSNKYYESALTDKEISIQLFSAAASK